MQRLVAQVEAVARTAATVPVQGESGVGKERIARRIHEESGRFRGPFVKLDCASIPANLIEAELFGQVSGAVPGSLRDRAGRIELADGGALFLDEVGDMPAELQANCWDRCRMRCSSAWATTARVEQTCGSSQRPAETLSSKSRGDSFGAICTSG